MRFGRDYGGERTEKPTSHLESGLRSFLFIQEQLRDSQRLHTVHILDVAEALAQSYVPVNAFAHAQ